MTEELKPCPFDGNTTLEIIREGEAVYSNGPAFYYVLCNKCGAQQLYTENVTKQLAIASWNKRDKHAAT